jgi:hypothetical protein
MELSADVVMWQGRALVDFGVREDQFRWAMTSEQKRPVPVPFLIIGRKLGRKQDICAFRLRDLSEVIQRSSRAVIWTRAWSVAIRLAAGVAGGKLRLGTGVSMTSPTLSRMAFS